MLSIDWSVLLPTLFTLTALELVLGIDNIIFISILADKLPGKLRNRARTLGLLIALVARVCLLFSITYIMALHYDLFTIGSMGFSGRELILMGGGIFLIYKTSKEIWGKIIVKDAKPLNLRARESFSAVILQIVLIDIVFSFDSILTAVGLVTDVMVMIAAVIIAMGFMMVFSNNIAKFVNAYPGIKMLAMVFLVAIGGLLILESFNVEVEKSYIYFAMVFSLLVELLNIRSRAVKNHKVG